MRLKLLQDSDTIKVYQIISPSKTFKKQFPRKHIFASLDYNTGENVLINSDQIPFKYLYSPQVGYIFTYAKTFDTKIGMYTKKSDMGKTFPTNLNQYFDDTDEIIVQIIPNVTAEFITPFFVNNYIIKLKLNDINNDKLYENMKQTVNNMMYEKMNTELFVIKVLHTLPLNNNMLPLNYHKEISDSIFKKKPKINMKDVFIQYDIKVNSREDEFNTVKRIESTFEDKNYKVVIYDTYTGLLNRLRQYMIENKIKFEDNGKSITTTYENLQKIKIDVSLLDLL